MDEVFKGILIDQSVTQPEIILKKVDVVNTRETTLEGESIRGTVLFHSIEVAKDQVWDVLNKVAETIKSPGWYFHLVNASRLYIVMPKAILISGNDDNELRNIVDYAQSHGIHPDQLNLKQLFESPYS